MNARILAVLWFALVACQPLMALDPVLPSQERALVALTESGFKETPIQIPATVIDTGILKFVPYLSYKIGEDREVNVYGDPAAPACIEIGLYRGLLDSTDEKSRCVAYLRRLLPNVDFMGLRLTGGKFLRGSMVVEITPPNSPDAYGGWWISAYNLPLLRASGGTSSTVNIVSVPVESAVATSEWSQSEMNKARPSPVSSSRSSGGRVYVREYTRKNGSYVRPHTRSK